VVGQTVGAERHPDPEPAARDARPGASNVPSRDLARAIPWGMGFQGKKEIIKKKKYRKKKKGNKVVRERTLDLVANVSSYGYVYVKGHHCRQRPAKVEGQPLRRRAHSFCSNFLRREEVAHQRHDGGTRHCWDRGPFSICRRTGKNASKHHPLRLRRRKGRGAGTFFLGRPPAAKHRSPQREGSEAAPARSGRFKFFQFQVQELFFFPATTDPRAEALGSVGWLGAPIRTGLDRCPERAGALLFFLFNCWTRPTHRPNRRRETRLKLRAARSRFLFGDGRPTVSGAERNGRTRRERENRHGPARWWGEIPILGGEESFFRAGPALRPNGDTAAGLPDGSRAKNLPVAARFFADTRHTWTAAAPWGRGGGAGQWGAVRDVARAVPGRPFLPFPPGGVSLGPPASGPGPAAPPRRAGQFATSPPIASSTYAEETLEKILPDVYATKRDNPKKSAEQIADCRRPARRRGDGDHHQRPLDPNTGVRIFFFLTRGPTGKAGTHRRGGSGSRDALAGGRLDFLDRDFKAGDKLRRAAGYFKEAFPNLLSAAPERQAAPVS